MTGKRNAPAGNRGESKQFMGATAGSTVPPAPDELPDGAPTIVREPTAWLRGRAGERVREICAMGLDPDGTTTIVVPLGRSGRIGSREERTCDRCRTYVPVGTLFYPVAHHPAKSVFVVGGLCASCVAMEVGA